MATYGEIFDELFTKVKNDAKSVNFDEIKDDFMAKFEATKEAVLGVKSKKKVGGLAGVVAGKSAIATVGTGAGLFYRGYNIYDLAAKCEFEEVAYLLLEGKLPNSAELTEFKAQLIKDRELPREVKEALKLVPANAHPMDVMRTGCSILGTIEQERVDALKLEFKDQLKAGIRLLGIFPSMLLFWHHFHKNGVEMDTTSTQDSIAGFFLEKLHNKVPKKLWLDAMNASLILYAEHEFNASTFTARVVTGTLLLRRLEHFVGHFMAGQMRLRWSFWLSLKHLLKRQKEFMKNSQINQKLWALDTAFIQHTIREMS